jgi:hypothetical protein
VSETKCEKKEFGTKEIFGNQDEKEESRKNKNGFRPVS